MKKAVMIAGTTAGMIWCALTAFISPIWLSLTYLWISGKIYQVDGMIDEGAAEYMGAISLIIWIIVALLPDLLILRKMKSYGDKFLWFGLGVVGAAALICFGLCRWNIIRFLTTPISQL